MRIVHGVRAALAVLVLAGVGAAGCSEDNKETEPVVSMTTTSSYPTSKTKSEPKADMRFESVEVHSTVDATKITFFLTGLIRNTGKGVGTFGVTCRPTDHGVALEPDEEAEVVVPNLNPGLASQFECSVESTGRNSVLWTYWGSIKETGATSPQYTIYYERTTPTAGVAFSDVKATLEGGDFHLKGTVKNTGPVSTHVEVAYAAEDAGVALASGIAPLVVSDLAPGASSTFDQKISAGAHTAVTWKYQGQFIPSGGSKMTTPVYTIGYPH